MEFKLIALDTTCLKVEWLKDLLSEFYIVPITILSISIHTDSKSIIEILKKKILTRR